MGRCLERLTEPFDLVHADEGASEQGEGHVDVVAALIAHGKTAQAGHPGMGAFHDPAMASQSLAAVHALAGDAGLDAAGPALRPASTVVIGLVGMQLARSAAWAAPFAGAHGWDRVQRGGQHHAIVAVGPTQGHAERRSPAVDDKVALGARLATV